MSDGTESRFHRGANEALSALCGISLGIGFVIATFSHSVMAQAKTAEIVSAADKFLSTLSDEQRQKVRYAYDDANQRARWSNFPTGFVPRGGINLKQMSAPQDR